MQSSQSTQHPRLSASVQINPVAVVLLLSAIVTINVLGNLYWIHHNVVLIGRDASNYLTTTLNYREILTGLTPQSLFQAFTFPDYRTPALYIAAQPFLYLFGFNMDSAQYLNVVLSASVVVLTYYLGATVAGRNVGLFAAAMVSLMPMMAAMARLFYTEMFLTAAVTTNLLALYRSNQFTHRAWAFVWGVSLGIGLLVKWTTPIYLWLPVLWMLWRMRNEFAQLRGMQIDFRRMLLAIVLSVALATVWFWPNRALAEHFWLGVYLWPGWILILAPLFYSATSRSTPMNNLFIALFAGLAIASLWYLPHIDVGAKLFIEDQVRSTPTAGVLNPHNYTRNFRHLYFAHFGALAFWLIAPAALWPWVNAWGRRRSLNRHAQLLWLSIISTFVVLSLILQQNPRNLVPILPALAIVATIGLFEYRPPIRRLLGAAWLIILGVQLLLFTTGSLFGFYQSTQSLWAMRAYTIQPASGDTAPEYWIAPKVLEIVDQHPETPRRLGVLVNIEGMHRGVFKYLNTEKNLDIQIVDVTEDRSMGWYDLLSAPWLLLKNGDNRDVDRSGQALIERILAGDPLFDALYDLEQTFPMPDDETLYLFRRTKGPGLPHDLPIRLADTHELAKWIQARWRPGTPLIYSTPDVAVWVGIHDPVQSPVKVLDPANGNLEDQFPQLEGTAFVVFDQSSLPLETWLDQHAYRGDDAGNDDAWVVVYGFAQSLPDLATTTPQWENATALTSLRALPSVQAGEVLPVEIEMSTMVDAGYKLSLRLVASDNTVIASQDRLLDETMRFGLFVPPATQAGSYQLIVVLYDAETLTNIPVSSDIAGDSVHIMIGEIQVTPS
jgi:4-amino-4-deoxy-L-arabinose transferase-like glycosyltransferase